MQPHGIPANSAHAPPTVLIAGPTASGKSALAVAIATAIDGVVINADSCQVYADLAILTARPTPAATARVAHELYGYVSGAEDYSVARWLSDIEPVLGRLAAARQPAVIVGGTGLYFKALTEGLSPIPAIDPSIRAHWRAEAKRLGPAPLYAELCRRDPDTAGTLRPSDPQRLVRALEVLDSTGQGLRCWHHQPGRPLIEARTAVKLVTALDRQRLHQRAGHRFAAMLAAGAEREVEQLLRQNLPPDRPIMQALGVRPLRALLSGELSRQAAIAAAERETRAYIKRQQTWLKRNMMSWRALFEQDLERISTKPFTLIER